MVCDDDELELRNREVSNITTGKVACAGKR